jgi:hypothetical protein
MLIIGVCILLRVYPVMLINHCTQQCFLVLVFIVNLHYMYTLIGGHLRAICDKIYSKVDTVYVNGSAELTRLRQVPWLCKSIQYIQYKNV